MQYKKNENFTGNHTQMYFTTSYKVANFRIPRACTITITNFDLFKRKKKRDLCK